MFKCDYNLVRHTRSPCESNFELFLAFFKLQSRDETNIAEMLSESKHTPRDINNTQNGKTNYLGRQKQTEAYIKSTIWRFGTFTFKGFSDFVTGERSEELS